MLLDVKEHAPTLGNPNNEHVFTINVLNITKIEVNRSDSNKTNIYLVSGSCMVVNSKFMDIKEEINRLLKFYTLRK